MNDRELLELAAKAAGYSDAKWTEYSNAPPTMVVQHERAIDGVTGLVWNPLEDDGDALRLAVKLGLEVQTKMGPYGDIVTLHHEELGDSLCERHGNDPCAAARRAIVRAAAAIGKAVTGDRQ